MALLDSVKLGPLSFDLSLTCVLEHAKAPGLRLGDGLDGASLNHLLLASFTSFTRLASGWDLRSRLGFGGCLAKGGEIHVTRRVNCLVPPHTRPQDLRIAQEALVLLCEACRLLRNDNFSLLLSQSRVHLQAGSFLEVSQKIFIDLVLIVDEKCRVKLLVRPVEVVVEFEQHQRRCGLENIVFSLGIGSAIGDEGGEEDLVLGRDAKVHHEVEVGKLVRVKLAHRIVHLVLLRFRRCELLVSEIPCLIAQQKVLVEELVYRGQLLLVRSVAV